MRHPLKENYLTLTIQFPFWDLVLHQTPFVKTFFLYLLRNEEPNLARGANCFSESMTRACPGTTALDEPWHTMMNLKEEKTNMKN